MGVIVKKQGVALTGRNRTGLPCSVGRLTGHAPGRRPVRPPAALQTTTDDRRLRAKQYCPIRRASNAVARFIDHDVLVPFPFFSYILRALVTRTPPIEVAVAPATFAQKPRLTHKIPAAVTYLQFQIQVCVLADRASVSPRDVHA